MRGGPPRSPPCRAWLGWWWCGSRTSRGEPVVELTSSKYEDEVRDFRPPSAAVRGHARGSGSAQSRSRVCPPLPHGTCSRSSLPTSPHPHAPPLTCPLTALRSAPPRAPPPRSQCTSPMTAPQATHTQQPSASALCSRRDHFITGGAQHAGTWWRPLPPARTPPRSGASQRAPARGRSSCAREPLSAG